MKSTPVPVEAAHQIAEKYKKSIVVIFTYDDRSGMIASASFGQKPAEKIAAASLAEKFAKLAGADMQRSEFFEDFRASFDAANYKFCLDQFTKLLGLWPLSDAHIAAYCDATLVPAARKIIATHETNLKAPIAKPAVVITVEGGVVQSVHADMDATYYINDIDNQKAGGPLDQGIWPINIAPLSDLEPKIAAQLKQTKGEK